MDDLDHQENRALVGANRVALPVLFHLDADRVCSYLLKFLFLFEPAEIGQCQQGVRALLWHDFWRLKGEVHPDTNLVWIKAEKWKKQISECMGNMWIKIGKLLDCLIKWGLFKYWYNLTKMCGGQYFIVYKREFLVDWAGPLEIDVWCFPLGFVCHSYRNPKSTFTV